MQTVTVAYIAAFCILSLGISALFYRWMKTYVLYVFASATVAALVLQLIGFVYYGRIDEWGLIAFPVTWLVAVGCATVYFFARRSK